MKRFKFHHFAWGVIVEGKKEGILLFKNAGSSVLSYFNFIESSKYFNIST